MKYIYSKKFFSILLLSVMVVVFSMSAYAAEYSTTGYNNGSNNIYIQNKLNNSTIYSNHFVTAVAEWNRVGVINRSIIVNTSSSSEVWNLDFSTGDASYQQKHLDGWAAFSRPWYQTTMYCAHHTTAAFEIVCNDAIFKILSSTGKRFILGHELGHQYGLIDYPYTNKNISIMSYLTDIENSYTPYSFDVKNANDCWAPHR